MTIFEGGRILLTGRVYVYPCRFVCVYVKLNNYFIYIYIYIYIASVVE